MGSGLGVVTAELDGLASGMEANPWFSPAVEVVAPDDLQVGRSAAANLNANARLLAQYQAWAEAEDRRTAEMLRTAARAYDHIDRKYAENIDDPSRTAELAAVAVPVPATPPPPEGPPPLQPLGAADYSDVHTTQRLLTGGDHGASLDVAEVHWGLAATSAGAHAGPVPVTNWEGDAADAARDRMDRFSGWCHDLSAAWQRLAQAAAKVRASHTAALAEHTNIYTRYTFLEARLQELAAQSTPANAAATGNEMSRIQREMEQLQRRSDQVREDYAGNATFDPVQVDRPPISSTAQAAAGGGTAGGAGAGGGAPTGDPAAVADEMARSLAPTPTGASPGTPAAQGGSPGGAPAGGSGQGAPAGVGTVPTAGATASGTRPAASLDRPGGGAVSGRGGGGSGGSGAGVRAGGLSPAPMSPAVKAETVAPGPTTPAGSAPAPGTARGSAMGGMGAGMAPIGAGAQQGKEKRRDPQVAPDEDLYTEDRPWTEAVIGQRRRRDGQAGGSAGEDPP